MQKLLDYIHSLVNFSEESWETLLPALVKVKFKKGEYLLKKGQICNSLFFINKGYCRSFFDDEGTEKNTAFYFEGDVATNLISFGAGQKSDYFIQACEPLEAIVFNKRKLLIASQKSHEIETLGKNCLRLTASKLEEHANLFKLYSAKERYEFLEQNHPELLQRVSLTQLSAYLGVRRETLSRIRKRRR